MQRSQIRAARALLSWSADLLAEKSGVPVHTIEQLEPGEWSLAADAGTMDKLQQALEEGGVEFIPANADGGPGVRLHASGVGSETVAATVESEGYSFNDPL
jgi:transcriptional regulator with XRE-family HTH domain